MDQIRLDPMLVTFVVAVLLPLLVGIVTKANAPTALKQVVSIAASIATGLVVTATQVDGVAVISKQAAFYAFVAFAVQTATYLGIYKPQNANANLAPSLGVGGGDRPDAP